MECEGGPLLEVKKCEASSLEMVRPALPATGVAVKRPTGPRRKHLSLAEPVAISGSLGVDFFNPSQLYGPSGASFFVRLMAVSVGGLFLWSPRRAVSAAGFLPRPPCGSPVFAR